MKWPVRTRSRVCPQTRGGRWTATILGALADCCAVVSVWDRRTYVGYGLRQVFPQFLGLLLDRFDFVRLLAVNIFQLHDHAVVASQFLFMSH